MANGKEACSCRHRIRNDNDLRNHMYHTGTCKVIFQASGANGTQTIFPNGVMTLPLWPSLTQKPTSCMPGVELLDTKISCSLSEGVDKMSVGARGPFNVERCHVAFVGVHDTGGSAITTLSSSYTAAKLEEEVKRRMCATPRAPHG
jgi:hypothetical protein